MSTKAHLRSVWTWLIARTQDRVLCNLGWYSLAEVGVRVSRLVTTIVLARLLLPEDYGLVAIALTAFEMVRVLANNGVGLTIVRAKVDDLERVCTTAFRISLGVVAGMVVLQLGVGALLAARTGRSDLFVMLAVLAASFLILPFTEVNYCRLLRAQRLKTIAGITATQVLLDNALTAALALAGFHVWAVILPKLLTAPVYAALLWRAEPWRPNLALASMPMAPIIRFALPVLGTEMLTSLRFNLDKVLVGAMLGVQALGIYSFAFNAGLGLSFTFTAALSASLYPHFCEVAQDRYALVARIDRALKSSVLLIVSVIALQSVAALVYVPIVFGDRWAFAAPLVAMLCASGIARPLFEAASQALRARGETHLDFAASMLFTTVLLSAFALALPSGLEIAITILAAVSILGHAAMLMWVRQRLVRSSIALSGAVA